MKKKKSAIGEFLALPDAEKERQWKEFDKEFVLETARPLSREMRGRWERAKRRGRPCVGKGAQAISLTVERGLLRRADSRAKADGISRAAFFARAVEKLLAQAG